MDDGIFKETGYCRATFGLRSCEKLGYKNASEYRPFCTKYKKDLLSTELMVYDDLGEYESPVPMKCDQCKEDIKK